MASLIHDTSPTLRHSLQQSHNKGLYYRGWADTILGSYIHGAAAVESIAMDGQSIGSKVAAAVTHNSDSQ